MSPATSPIQQRALRLLDHQSRIEVAVSDGHLWKMDRRLSVTTAIIRFAYEVEQQLETVFSEIVLGRRKISGVHPRVDFRSASVLREHIYQGRPYVDWLPYEHTEKRAKLYLRAGRPFTDLESQERRAFVELSAIRNVLAHESAHSKKRFETTVINAPTRSVPRHEWKVERYLISESTPGTTRLEQHMAECIRALGKLT